MKIVQINDNLKINIEMIYSLEKHDNQFDINEWESNYKEYLNTFLNDPPLLAINDDELFRPEQDNTNNKDKLKLYGEALNKYILDIIGEKPSYREEFYVILCTGLKVNIDKTIYNKIDKYLESYID